MFYSAWSGNPFWWHELGMICWEVVLYVVRTTNRFYLFVKMSAFLKQDTNLTTFWRCLRTKRVHPFSVNLLQKCRIEKCQILFVCKMRATYPFFRSRIPRPSSSTSSRFYPLWSCSCIEICIPVVVVGVILPMFDWFANIPLCSSVKIKGLKTPPFLPSGLS